MATIDQDEAQSRRREVGRKLLFLTTTLAETLWLFRQSKHDAADLDEVRAKCDDALRAMRDSFDALVRFRRSLGAHDDAGVGRLSRPSHPQPAT